METAGKIVVVSDFGEGDGRESTVGENQHVEGRMREGAEAACSYSGLALKNSAGGSGGKSHAGTRPVRPRRVCACQLHVGTSGASPEGI